MKIAPGLSVLLDTCWQAFIDADADATLAEVVEQQLQLLSAPDLNRDLCKLVQANLPGTFSATFDDASDRYVCEMLLSNHLVPVLLQDAEVMAKIKKSSHADGLPAKYAA